MLAKPIFILGYTNSQFCQNRIWTCNLAALPIKSYRMRLPISPPDYVIKTILSTPIVEYLMVENIASFLCLQTLLDTFIQT